MKHSPLRRDSRAVIGWLGRSLRRPGAPGSGIRGLEDSTPATRRRVGIFTSAALVALLWAACVGPVGAQPLNLESGFRTPPHSARPWVYWFVMDGNQTKAGITADFEALKRVGIGGVIFMEVDVGVPKGPVKFMSPEWRDVFKHANTEAARLGLTITMPASPGWTGSGGPWVKPEQSMQKLVVSETAVAGPTHVDVVLPKPPVVAGFYRDVAVLAFPTPAGKARVADIEEKALYHRGHFSSEAGVKPLLPQPAQFPTVPADQVVKRDGIVDLTGRLDATGKLAWDAPAGAWTILRFGHTSTGANTRPAPEPGLGLECDKLDKAALDAHFHDFLGKIVADLGPLTGKSLTALHIDSWEMGPQNWTARFPEEFQARRGYDLRRYLPAMTGRVVDSLEVSERFLWDVRQTVLELITENHAAHLAELAHKNGMRLSIEPYDGTPCDDMTYGARADVPMGEFWYDTFKSWFSCTEAASIGHTYGRPVVQAEAFTCAWDERWLAHPAILKTLGDWAFCEGINRFVFHRYAHQPWLNREPGMTMGPYGIHYDRTQTWFEMSKAWNMYLSRCQFLLQQGHYVADVAFLKPEASPQVFVAPGLVMPDPNPSNPPGRAGYRFDAVNPEVVLTRMDLKDGRLVLPDEMSYRLLVLPVTPAMTPALLRRVVSLVERGATVLGTRPGRSPGLSGYPACDAEVSRLADTLWGDLAGASAVGGRRVGLGRVLWGKTTEEVLPEIAGPPDFEVEGRLAGEADLAFIHRTTPGAEIYFVARRGETPLPYAACVFRTERVPELWDPETGSLRELVRYYRTGDGRTVVPLQFEGPQSYFIVFRKPIPRDFPNIPGRMSLPTNFPDRKPVADVPGPWDLTFPPGWETPAKVTLDRLASWSDHPDAGVQHFSGTATYHKTLTVPASLIVKGRPLTLDLGNVQVMAEATLNGRDLGIAWKPPYRFDISDAIKPGDNDLVVKVVNLWPNRLIADAQKPADTDRSADGMSKSWPQWLLDGKPSPTGRLTFAAWNPWKGDAKLLPSGLIGPVRLLQTQAP
jgi:alpha-L-rhamnosidase